jgi:myo-inositol-1(or 4)-monophosphatase
MPEYETEYNFALGLVKDVAGTIKEAFYRTKNITTKSAPNDLVTETDQEVERIIKEKISGQFPGHRFIGEETVAGGVKCELTDDPTWVLDPIDGTTNFVHSNFNICTIVTFMVNKEVQFCAVNNPILEYLWTARKGKGAFLNGDQIHVSKCTDLSSALLLQEANMLNNNSQFIVQARGVRANGSAGINLCLIAMGAADLYFEIGFHIWDYSGPSLIVEEAGGVVKDISGKQTDFLARNCIAGASQELIDQVLPQIKTWEVERD